MKASIKALSVLGLAALSYQVNAQTLLEIGNSKISKEEFLKSYERNSIKGKVNYSEAAVRDYLNYYTVYKMKLKQAEEQKVDTIGSVRRELENYKNQLVLNYLKDKAIDERLTKEAYERLKEEIEVGHIFVSFALNGDHASHKRLLDSLYTLIQDKKITFEDAAKQFSGDKSTAVNGGYIGYITTLQTDHLFENAMYAAKVNTVTKPIKTSVGWHLIKIYNRRPNQGKVQIQQILVTSQAVSSPEKVKAAEQKVATIEAELKKGTSFDHLIATYSDDAFSKSKNGLLEPFRAGDLSKPIEDAAFGLKKVGDIAGPIKTDYGYHFIKLVKKIPLESFDQLKEELTNKVENDQRSVDAHSIKNEEVKKSINFVMYQNVLDSVKQSAKVSADFYDVLAQTNYQPNATLFSIGATKYSARDFVKYIEVYNKGRVMNPKNSDKLISDFYANYSNRTITDFRFKKLFDENKDFRETLNIYNEGIIIYDMNQTNIWKRANDDTLGLSEFYNQNKDNYIWQPGFNGKVFQSNVKADAERLVAELNKGTEPNAAFDALIADEKNPAKLKVQDGRFEVTKYNITTKDLSERKPSKVIDINGNYYVLFPFQIYNGPTNKTLIEAKGFVVSDYQAYLETEWLASLKKKYPLKINESVLKTVFK